MLTWSPLLALGHARLDVQHQGLFAIVDRLHVAAASPQDVSALLAELRYYTVLHFAEEELVMQTAGYPDAATHAALHRNFEQALAQLERRLAVEPFVLVLRDLRTFSSAWLYQHILHIDKQFAPYIAERG